MALFKVLRGDEKNLFAEENGQLKTPLKDGNAYFTQDTHNFYIDYEKDGIIQRSLSGAGKNTIDGNAHFNKGIFTANSVAGVMGYYFTNIDFDKKQITLSLKQNETLFDENSVVGYEIGDIISISNNAKYYNCATIKEINNNKITVDQLPFNSMYETEVPTPDEWNIFVINKPNVGGVKLGINASAFGENANALERSSFAEGRDTVAYGTYSHAEGRGTQAGFTAHAEGSHTIASNAYAHAEGQGSKASGVATHAEGLRTKAIGDYAHTEGLQTIASKHSAHAEGQATTASGVSSHAEGQGSKASGVAAHAEGVDTKASGQGAHAEGYDTQAIGNYSHTEGAETIASGHFSHAEGGSNVAYGAYAHAEGAGTHASRYAAHAEGAGTHASRYAAHAEGKGSVASGDSSHAEGFETLAEGEGSHAEGYDTQAIGNYSHAEGAETIASGHFSHAEGGSNVASEYYTHAEGAGTHASRYAAHAEGQSSEASNVAAHAEGKGSVASGDSSHAEGFKTLAEGEGSHAEGFRTKASGQAAHAEGQGSEAIGISSHAEGYYAKAEGLHSHAEGQGTIAQGINQHVQGKYNIKDEDDYFAFIIGNGENDTKRSNAMAVGWNGDAYFSRWIIAPYLLANYVQIETDEGQYRHMFSDRFYTSYLIKTIDIQHNFIPSYDYQEIQHCGIKLDDEVNDNTYSLKFSMGHNRFYSFNELFYNEEIDMTLTIPSYYLEHYYNEISRAGIIILSNGDIKVLRPYYLLNKGITYLPFNATIYNNSYTGGIK